MAVTATAPPMILDRIAVAEVERLSPSFVRVVFAGDCLADFGVDGPLLDQRIKLLFPSGDGALPSLDATEDSWYTAWLALPPGERGHLRTYTVRELRGSGAGTRLVVDFVLHVEQDAHCGPGSSWAARAALGDQLVLLGPRRGVAWGGIEFVPGSARRVLLAGDETAVPAACAVLAGLPASSRGAVFLEVPESADVRDVTHPAGVELVWLPREGREVGTLLRPAVLAHLGAGAEVGAGAGPVVEVGGGDDDVDADLWETPSYSSSGEPVDGPIAAGAGPEGLDGLYAWIAGESRVVTGLRRTLVDELGMDRRQVAFMGYWRRGVAMGS